MKLIELARFFVFIAEYIVIIPVLVGIYRREHLSKALKILIIGLVATTLLNVVSHLFFFSEKNTILYFFSTIDVLTTSLMYSTALYYHRSSKFIRLLGFIFLPLIAVDAFLWSGTQNNGLSNTLVLLMILSLSIFYLMQLFKDTTAVKLTDEPLFWVSIGYIVNNMIGFFDVFSNPMMTYSQSLYLQFYIVWSIATIFMYCCFAYAFWQSKKVYAV